MGPCHWSCATPRCVQASSTICLAPACPTPPPQHAHLLVHLPDGGLLDGEHAEPLAVGRQQQLALLVLQQAVGCHLAAACLRYGKVKSRQPVWCVCVLKKTNRRSNTNCRVFMGTEKPPTTCSAAPGVIRIQPTPAEGHARHAPHPAPRGRPPDGTRTGPGRG